MTAYSMTGTRRLGSGASIISSVLLRPPAGAPSSFSSGAQRGADTAFALYAARVYPDVDHVLVCPAASYNDGLPQEVRAVLAEERRVRSLPGPPRLEVVRMGFERRETPAANYLRRNGLVLERGAGALLAFPEDPQERRRGSGTWACIREARRRRIPIYVYPVDGSPSWAEEPA